MIEKLVQLADAVRKLLDYGAVFISLASLLLTGFALWMAYKYLENKLIIDSVIVKLLIEGKK